jgi:hypothetical protein
MSSSKFVADNIYAVIGTLILLLVVYAKVIPMDFKAKVKENILFKAPMISKVTVDFLKKGVFTLAILLAITLCLKAPASSPF